MGLYTICTGYQKETFRDGQNQVSQSKVQQGSNDYAPMNAFAPGFEINPANGEFIIVDKINGSNSFMVSIGGINQAIEPITARGERLIYSVSENGLTKKASAHFKNDGTLVLNSGAIEAARKGDTVQLTLSSTDIQTLAAALLVTGAFVPTGTPPAPGTITVLTDGEITGGTDEILLP